MNLPDTFSLSSLPEDGLRLFHGLSNWVEKAKTSKPKLIGWKDGIKQLTLLNCVKLTRVEPMNIPATLAANTLYVPKKYCGQDVFRQLRHAFCHNGLSYNQKAQQYEITITPQINITGRFSKEAIEEFLSVYLQPAKNNKQAKKQSK